MRRCELEGLENIYEIGLVSLRVKILQSFMFNYSTSNSMIGYKQNTNSSFPQKIHFTPNVYRLEYTKGIQLERSMAC